MKTIITIAVGVSFIILAGGTIHYIHDKNFNFGGVVALALVALVMAGALRHMTRQPDTKSKGPSSDELTQRIVTLEKRLTDIQDIVISIDDRLSRPEVRRDQPSSA